MDNSPTQLFNSYEQEFNHIISSIRQKLEGDTQNDSGEQRKAALRRVEMELDEADELVRPSRPPTSNGVSYILRTGLSNGDRNTGHPTVHPPLLPIPNQGSKS